MSKPDHIFVVGLSRTGTNLMRRILNCSNDIAICGETHFLKHWFGFSGYKNEFKRIGDISNEAGCKNITSYIYNLENNWKRGRGFWRWLPRNIDRREFIKNILDANKNEHTLLDLLMDLYANGKPIRGEKTPSHLNSIPTLIKWYPNSKIIHMFRDPRAIFVSTKNFQLTRKDVNFPYFVLRKSEILLEYFLSIHILLTWFHAINLHKIYKLKYPNNYYLCKFENLIKKPESELRKLCYFLEIDWTSDLMNISYQNSSVRSNQYKKGYDLYAIDRWKNSIKPIINKWLILWCKKHLIKFGYPL